MKPRTKLQHEVFELSRNLDPLTDAQKDWAFKECMLHKGFATKSRVICMDCGETFSPELVNRKKATCPHCQTKLKIESTRKSTDEQREYFALAEVHFEYQLIRNFRIFSYHKKGKPVRFYAHEILQYWITPNGKVEMVGHLHNVSGYCDSWGGEWAIRKNYMRGYYYNGGKYIIYPWKYHPKSKFKKEYRKYGIDHSVVDALNILDAIKIIPQNSVAETLLKAKQYSLVKRFKENSREIHCYWPSIKICIRNKYKVKDAGIWMDYMDLLQYFNKDLRNAHYVCPKNLKREHDRLVKKKRRIQEAQELKLKKERAVKDEKEFIKMKSNFFGLLFTQGNITIKVLESVQEFVEEGDKLKHCLFANNYHRKKDSLILSAMVDGKTMETIEVSLKDFTILQSRGLHNNPTKHHDAIVKCMQSNMSKVKRLTRKPKVKKLNQQNYVEAV